MRLLSYLADGEPRYGVLAGGGVVDLTQEEDIRRGDTFHADYGPSGSVSCQFV